MANMQRNYNTKDVDMLITAATILESAINNKVFLQSKKTCWGRSFFDELKASMDNDVQKYLGMGSMQNLRKSALVFRGLQREAMKGLLIMKLQLEEDFKKDKQKLAKILDRLGFTTYYDDAQQKGQAALINLLSQFRENASQELKAEMMNNGIAKPLIDRLLEYDKALKKAGITPKSYYSAEKRITAKAIAAFNKIYDSIISICKTAAKFYKETDPLRDQFHYNSVAKSLNVKKATISNQLIAA